MDAATLIKRLKSIHAWSVSGPAKNMLEELIKQLGGRV